MLPVEKAMFLDGEFGRHDQIPSTGLRLLELEELMISGVLVKSMLLLLW